MNDTGTELSSHLQEISDRQLRSTKHGNVSHHYCRKPFQNKNGNDTLSSFVDSLNTVTVPYAIEYYPDLLQILEFLNVHMDFLGVRSTFPKGVTLQYIENAIINRDKGSLYQLTYIFMSFLFKFSVESMSIGEGFNSMKPRHLGSFTKAIMNRIYKCEVHELPCDEFTISEVLRLHLLISSAPLEDFKVHSDICSNVNLQESYNASQKIAQEFIEKHGTIIQALHHTSIFQLSTGDLLKIFICLLNQVLTFDVVRNKIEEHYLVSPPNYLGRDESGRTYWRFNSIPGIYIDCNDNIWKFIDTIENVNLLTEAVKRPLKKNLLFYGSVIIKQIIEPKKRETVNNSIYQFVFFNSDDWLQIWQNKWSGFQNSIQELGLLCDTPMDSDLFKQSFLNWKIPSAKSNGTLKPIYLGHRKNFSIELNLCRTNNIPEIPFSTEHVELMQELASKIAYIYYSLNRKNVKNRDMLISETIFEMFLRVESVAELYLSFYKLYEYLFACSTNCHICHTDRFKRTKTCETCGRQIHPICLEKIPIAVQMSCRLCHICQFRLL